MKAVEFEEVNVRIAEDQEEYVTLPAYWNKDEGSVTCCFELDEEELAEVAKTGKIYFKQLHFNGPVAPIALSTRKEVLIPKEKPPTG